MRATPFWCNLAKNSAVRLSRSVLRPDCAGRDVSVCEKDEGCFGNLRHYHHKFSLSSPTKHCEKMVIIHIKYSESLVFTVWIEAWFLWLSFNSVSPDK
jgi:hypothetical protein